MVTMMITAMALFVPILMNVISNNITAMNTLTVSIQMVLTNVPAKKDGQGEVMVLMVVLIIMNVKVDFELLCPVDLDSDEI